MQRTLVKMLQNGEVGVEHRLYALFSFGLHNV